MADDFFPMDDALDTFPPGEEDTGANDANLETFGSALSANPAFTVEDFERERLKARESAGLERNQSPEKIVAKKPSARRAITSVPPGFAGPPARVSGVMSLEEVEAQMASSAIKEPAKEDAPATPISLVSGPWGNAFAAAPSASAFGTDIFKEKQEKQIKVPSAPPPSAAPSAAAPSMPHPSAPSMPHPSAPSMPHPSMPHPQQPQQLPMMPFPGPGFMGMPPMPPHVRLPQYPLPLQPTPPYGPGEPQTRVVPNVGEQPRSAWAQGPPPMANRGPGPQMNRPQNRNLAREQPQKQWEKRSDRDLHRDQQRERNRWAKSSEMMTAREIEMLVRIQLNQISSEYPYVSDHYFQVMMSRQLDGSRRAPVPLYPIIQRRSLVGSQNRSQPRPEEGQKTQSKREQEREERKDNLREMLKVSLGMPVRGSTKAPRRMIGLGNEPGNRSGGGSTTGDPMPNADKPAPHISRAEADEGVRDVHADEAPEAGELYPLPVRRALRLQIEEAFSRVLDLEDISAGIAADKRNITPQVGKVKLDVSNELVEFWRLPKDENNEENIPLIFDAWMDVEKGKKVICRALPLLANQTHRCLLIKALMLRADKFLLSFNPVDVKLTVAIGWTARGSLDLITAIFCLKKLRFFESALLSTLGGPRLMIGILSVAGQICQSLEQSESNSTLVSEWEETLDDFLSVCEGHYSSLFEDDGMHVRDEISGWEFLALVWQMTSKQERRRALYAELQSRIQSAAPIYQGARMLAAQGTGLH